MLCLVNRIHISLKTMKVVKGEMARVNINNLGISELKWMGMENLIQMTLVIYYCGQESLGRSGVAFIVNKRLWNTVLGCNLKNDRMISVSKSNCSVTNADEAEVEWVSEDLLEQTPKMSFSSRGLECKSRKSRDTWSNRQVWPWSTKWSRAKANRVLPREFNGHSKHPLSTTQEKTLDLNITRWSILKSDWLYSL